MNEEMILNCLRTNGPMTSRQICIACNEENQATLQRTRRLLKSMHKFRMVSQIGTVMESNHNPSYLWEVVE